jgi:hypothetical protein
VGTRGGLAVMNVADTARARLTRREMVARLLASIGAGVALPLAAESHPIHELLRSDAVLDGAEKLEAADWKPAFLSAEQNESLIAIAESLVPGSGKAQANRFIDLLLSVDTPEHKKKFLDSLRRLKRSRRGDLGADSLLSNHGRKICSWRMLRKAPQKTRQPAALEKKVCAYPSTLKT